MNEDKEGTRRRKEQGGGRSEQEEGTMRKKENMGYFLKFTKLDT